MTTYAILLLPSANRVYADASPRLMSAELEVLNQSVLGGCLTDAEQSTIGGIPCLVFESPELTEEKVSLLANLSSIYGLFRLEGDLLAPIELHRLDRYDDDLVTIQKYQGKTNEQFTKLLLNVTLWSSKFADSMLTRPSASSTPCVVGGPPSPSRSCPSTTPRAPTSTNGTSMPTPRSCAPTSNANA